MHRRSFIKTTGVFAAGMGASNSFPGFSGDMTRNYGEKITSNPNLRKTFVLNSLVGVDNAAWLLYAAENGITNFDEMIPRCLARIRSTPNLKIRICT